MFFLAPGDHFFQVILFELMGGVGALTGIGVYQTPARTRELIHKRMKEARVADYGVRLAILPTFACNLACKYCFQERSGKAPSLTSQHIEELCSFAEACLKRSNGALRIMWFGGEPLLNVSFILDATQKLTKIAANQSREFSASMISNGTRLSNIPEEVLAQMQLSALQITLDGPAGVHDERRPTHAGRGSFTQTLQGIHRAVDAGIETRIRVNLDRNNIGRFTELISILKDENLLDKIKIAPSPVRTDQGQNEYYRCGQPTGEEWVNRDLAALETLRRFDALDSLETLLPAQRLLPCSAQLENSFVIGSDGLVYKCLNDPPHDARAIGPLGDPEGVFHVQDNASSWAGQLRAFAAEETEMCGGCGFLSICAGGCPASRIARSEKSENCTPWRHLLGPRLEFLSRTSVGGK